MSDKYREKYREISKEYLEEWARVEQMGVIRPVLHEKWWVSLWRYIKGIWWIVRNPCTEKG